MELQAIAARRAEYFQLAGVAGRLGDAARGKTHPAHAQGPDTRNVEECEALTQNWVEVHRAWRSRSLPITPLPAPVQKQRMTIEDAVALHVAKLVAFSPMEVKSRVVFRTNAAGEFY